MKLRRAVTHLAVASLTFVILVITVDRPALAQFGDLLDKAKQAAESARKAGEMVREALGSGTGGPVSPAKGGDAPATPPAGESGGNSDSTCLRETGMVRWHYQNNCGVDLTVLFASKDRRSCTDHWLYAGQSTTIAPTAAVCRGRAERGLCACPAGSGMETPQRPPRRIRRVHPRARRRRRGYVTGSNGRSDARGTGACAGGEKGIRPCAQRLVRRCTGVLQARVQRIPREVVLERMRHRRDAAASQAGRRMHSIRGGAETA